MWAVLVSLMYFVKLQYCFRSLASTNRLYYGSDARRKGALSSVGSVIGDVVNVIQVHKPDYPEHE